MAAVLENALGDDVQQVVPVRWFNPTPPCIDIYPANPFRSGDAAGFGEIDGAYRFVVRARVNAIDNDAGQYLLLAMVDDEHELCVAVALEDDQTLNGLASSVDVEHPTDFGMHDDLGNGFFGCTWTVNVLRVLS